MHLTCDAMAENRAQEVAFPSHCMLSRRNTSLVVPDEKTPTRSHQHTANNNKTAKQNHQGSRRLHARPDPPPNAPSTGQQTQGSMHTHTHRRT